MDKSPPGVISQGPKRNRKKLRFPEKQSARTQKQTLKARKKVVKRMHNQNGSVILLKEDAVTVLLSSAAEHPVSDNHRITSSLQKNSVRTTTSTIYC